MARRRTTAQALRPVDELIDDSAVKDGTQDRLGHAAVAAELASLSLTVSTPNNIALFGPWGSGKTGIGNLVEADLRLRKAKVRFVRYDAYKYAETPLRRHFLEAVAGQIGGKASQIVRDGYETTTTNTLRLPSRDVVTALAAFGVALAGYLIVSVALLALAGAGLRGAAAAVQSSLPGGVVLSAIGAIVFAALGKSLTVQVSKTAPTTDDQFESLFRRMVDTVREERLIVFIDELDRCSPKEVTATLDAVRTFLGVPRCIFIVSADQQVLERALSSGLRQHTPIDVTNPYYTSGSAVLDKLFAQQVFVPPPLPRRLTQYARDIVQGRPGLWAEIDLDLVVSVLIPSHVTSPRRIKTLLNSFAVQFRLASRRVAEGRIDGPMTMRAQELAKLTCLRTEFPLFATHLADDSELINLVVAIHLGKLQEEPAVKPPLVHSATWALARDFAIGHAPVDVLVASPTTSTGGPGGEADGAVPSTAVDVAQQAQSEQFLDYLVRTRAVAGPSADLVHLEHGGKVYGLTSEAARRLELAAVNGDVDQTMGLAREMAASESGQRLGHDDGRQPVIRIIVEIAKHAALGIEADNIGKVLLGVAGRSEGLDQHDADLAVDCLRGLGFPPITDAAQCHDVLRLIGQSSLTEALLVDRALAFARDIGEPSAELDAELVRVGAQPAIISALSAPGAFAAAIRRSEQARSALADMEGQSRRAIVATARPALLQLARSETAAATGPSTAAAPATTVASQPPLPTEVALADLVARFGRDSDIGGLVIEVALDADRRTLRDAVFQLLRDGCPIPNAETAVAIVKALRRRYVAEWAPVLRSIGSDLLLADSAETRALLLELRESVLHVGSKVGAEDEDQDSWAESLTELRRVTAGIGSDLGSALDDESAAAVAALDSDSLASLQSAGVAVSGLLDLHLMSGTNAIDALMDHVATALRDLAGDALSNATEWVDWVATMTTDRSLIRVSDAALDALFAAVPLSGGAGVNLTATAVREYALRFAFLRRERTPISRLLTPDVIVQWFEAPGSLFSAQDHANALTLADTAAELWTLLRTVNGPPASETLSSLAKWLEAHPTEADGLAKIAIESAVTSEVDLNLASAVVSHHISGETLADELVRHFEASDDYAAHLNVLRLWQALGVSGEKPISLLVRRVFIPFIKSGAEAPREAGRSLRVLVGASVSAQKEAIDLLRRVTRWQTLTRSRGR